MVAALIGLIRKGGIVKVMDKQKIAEIAAQLQQAKDAGKPFGVARQELLDSGYSESDLALTVANDNPYLPKPPPDPLQNVKDYLKDNPEAAEKASNVLAETVHRDIQSAENKKLAGAMIGAGLPGPWGSKHIVTLLEVLGLPLLVLVLVRILAEIFLTESYAGSLSYVLAVAVFALVIFRIIRSHRIK